MRTIKRQRGQGLIEYALIILLLVGFLGGGVIVAKDPILSLFNGLNGPVNGGSPTPGTSGNPAPTPTPNGSAPTEQTTAVFPPNYTYVSGANWSANATVIVTFASGDWIGQELGSFTVGPDGGNNNTPVYVNGGLASGSYGLLFTSGNQTATATLNILDSAPPQGWASDTGVGGNTTVGGQSWAADATVTVTYASGPDSGQTLGTFTVNSYGNTYRTSSNGTSMAVDPALSVGAYSLSLVSGAQTAVVTLNINGPQGYASDAGVGDNTELSGYYWAPNATVTVTYTSGPDSGNLLGTFVVGADGNSTTGTATPVAADLTPGTYDLSFTSATQNTTGTLSIWNPDGDASDAGAGGITNIDGYYWAPNATVTVAYASGPDNGTVLGTFVVDANGNSGVSTPMTVAANLTSGTYDLSFTAGAQNATIPLNILSPVGSASDAMAGDYSYLGGSYWSPNSTVTITYTSGPDSGQVLGTFTVDVTGGSSGNDSAIIDPDLAPGNYDLSFDSGSLHAVNTITVAARPAPTAYASPDVRIADQVNVSGAYWPANATVTVTYLDGPAMGTSLGTFTVDAAGTASGNDWLAVEPSLSLGNHDLSFTSGGQTASATFNIVTPTGYASDAPGGGNTYVSGGSWASAWRLRTTEDVVTVTYASGPDNGVVLGTFTTDGDGWLWAAVPLAVDPSLDPGAYNLRFTSSEGQSIIVPFNILSSSPSIVVSLPTGITGNGPSCQGDLPASTNGTIYIGGTQIGNWAADASGNLNCVITLAQPTTTVAYEAIPGASTCTFKTTHGAQSYDLANTSCNPQSYLRWTVLESVTIDMHPDYFMCGEQGLYYNSIVGCLDGYAANNQGGRLTMFKAGVFSWAPDDVANWGWGRWSGTGGPAIVTTLGRSLIVTKTPIHYTGPVYTGCDSWQDDGCYVVTGNGLMYPYQTGDISAYQFEGGVWTWSWDHTSEGIVHP
jgi:hypothetical protein